MPEPRERPPRAPPGLALLRRARRGLLDRFDLSADQADPAVVDAAVRAGVPFRGTNLWLLIFAIVIASVGLNVNSTAVIIGAMLISPLMGPILGVGYGAAVADFRLVRLALVNLLIATSVSLAASAAYFALTPLGEAHSELLARTSPTLWDVLIALFGGLAGVVGATRREKSNVVPGVAIATALMPPLCTAGYALANGRLAWFVGAFYLFSINSVFIATATFVMARVMRLPEVEHVDAAASRRAHRWIAVAVLGTALPSLLLAQRLVAAEVFNARAGAFLAAAFPPGGATVVVGRELDPALRSLRVTVVGDEVSPAQREALAALLPQYGLDGASLAVAQNERQVIDVTALREGLVRDLYQHSLEDLEARAATIDRLEGALAVHAARGAALRAIEAEVAAQVPEAARVVAASTLVGDKPALVVLLEGATPLGAERRDRLLAWLRVRAEAGEAWVLEVPTPGGAPEAGRAERRRR